jgi:glycosyltransferase involved in cell wall biosynthesis
VLHPEFPVDEHDGAAVLGFLGNLHYPPNAVAARRLRDRIFPAVRTRVPEATLLLIGRGPPADLRTAVDGVVVTGEVESIWEPMARVTVFVLPVDTGAGMQNKLLEAMAIGAAVVTTPGCAKAIGATAGVHCLVAHTDDEFVTATLGLLRHDSLRRDVGAIGRQLVAERFEWPTLLPRFEQVVFGTDR